MLRGPAPAKASWTPPLATIGVGFLVGVGCFVGLLSQWGQPTTNIATASLMSGMPAGLRD